MTSTTLLRPAPSLTGRAFLLAALTATLQAGGIRWAWQGAPGAPERWASSTGAADLDLWVERLPATLVHLLDSWPAARVADARDPRRLRHTTWAVPLDEGVAVVDVTVGDLAVGAVRLLPAAAVTTDEDHRLSGDSAVLDLVVRPLLRGRLVEGDRLAEGRRHHDPRGNALDLLRAQDHRLAEGVAAVLEATGPVPTSTSSRLVRRARRLLVRRTLARRQLGATWAQRRTIAPALRRGPAGLGTRGVVVAFVGTDGSGKSTVLRRTAAALEELDVTTREVYLGMGHGNLPGVGLARRLLGVDAPRSSDAPSPGGASTMSMAPLRRVAAWYYAAEYVLRWVTQVWPARLRGHVVLCDRWVTDLAESPWPGSPAATAVRRLLPRPHVLVLPDAPDELIHARKPERTAQEQAAQQQWFRALAASGDAGPAVVVDTSGREADVSGAVVAVLAAMHRTGPPAT